MAITISIIIPTHDRPGPLREVIESLFVQTRLPDELIIVNDGADDLSADISKILKNSPVRCEVIRPAEASSATSRNAGLDASDGDIVVCLDDDMVLDSRMLEKLSDLYRRDTSGLVDGVTMQYRDEPDTWQWRLWEAVAAGLGRMRWQPRRQKSRYVQLPAELARLLEPTARLSSGAMSLRGDVARWARFDETMKGYAFGEDRDFSYRLGQTHALFRTREVWIRHAPEPGGRGAMFQRGWAYVDNSLYIASCSVEGGAGTIFLICYDFAGTIFQYLLWGALKMNRGNIAFALGLSAALCSRGWKMLKESICG